MLKEIGYKIWDSRFNQIIHNAYDYQKNIFGKTCSTNNDDICFLNHLYILILYSYKNCINPKIPSRNSLFNGIINETKIAVSLKDDNYLYFLSKILCSIEYYVEEEPLYIISLCKKLISQNSNEPLKKLSIIFKNNKNLIDKIDEIKNILYDVFKYSYIISIIKYLSNKYNLSIKKINEYDIKYIYYIYSNQSKSREILINKNISDDNEFNKYIFPNTIEECKEFYKFYDELLEDYCGNSQNDIKEIKTKKRNIKIERKTNIKKRKIKSISLDEEDDSDYEE